MKVKKKPISKEEAISLYHSGLSQKDIMQEHEITHKQLSTILRAEGYSTSKFRVLDEDIKQVVLLLIQKGVAYQEIEAICDISFHAIRELVIKADMQGHTRHIRITSARVFTPLPQELEEQFFSLYCAGTTFCYAVRSMGLSEREIFRAYCSIKKNKHVIDAHKNSLKTLIQEDLSAGFSITAIANKRKLSRSLVKKLVNAAQA